jgi:hypothetical protein
MRHFADARYDILWRSIYAYENAAVTRLEIKFIQFSSLAPINI